ncbi:MAG TPA: ATP-binding protein [Candidatus Sulfotelmatobacter sp.]|nr:ATP-binding protein [Candidatus Sulfotelmatobacter sp.]
MSAAPDLQNTAVASRATFAAIARIRALLEQKLGGEEAAIRSDASSSGAGDQTIHSATDPADKANDPADDALQILCREFHLSSFEADILALCAGVELDPAFSALCAAMQDENRRSATLRIALEVLPDAHWSALLPEAPLRRWKLLDLNPGEILTTSPLRMEEPVLHFLMGAPVLDERLRACVEAIEPSAELPGSYRPHAEKLVGLWSKPDGSRTVVQLQGNAIDGKSALAAAACAALGLRLFALRVGALPPSSLELEAFARLWERDAVLTGSALLLRAENATTAQWESVSSLADRINGPLLVAGSGALEMHRHELLTLTVDRPKGDEQRALWKHILGKHAEKLNGELDSVTSHFALDFAGIRTSAKRVLDAIEGERTRGKETDVLPLIWEACRGEARGVLDGRAQRIEVRAGWNDLVLPEASLNMLHTVAVHVRQQEKVLERWGFAAQTARGLGVTALFSGQSGTGKTLAAEVLANELHLDLYRIDLSQVVSKYIGETEKNLRAVFDVAENSGAILLFDEADALFGKRSEVKDSHDRYANIEVSYLLQRMEAYRGLAILTTNMRAALDAAFLRRIRFIVNFPFPDHGLRRRIWACIFPAQTPTAGLDLDKLARLNLPGGNIRNVALNAAFLAADEGSPVRMEHLLTSAQHECGKLEKQLSNSEVGGWT